MANELKNCRICGSEQLETVLDLGEIYPSDFVKTQKGLKKEPLALVKCQGCGLVQLKDTVELDTMYKQKYWYVYRIASLCNPLAKPMNTNEIKEDLISILSVLKDEHKIIARYSFRDDYLHVSKFNVDVKIIDQSYENRRSKKPVG